MSDLDLAPRLSRSGLVGQSDSLSRGGEAYSRQPRPRVFLVLEFEYQDMFESPGAEPELAVCCSISAMQTRNAQQRALM